MDVVVLVLITFIAAIVNGALGYGFSSITVPVALLFYTNRILNPALVLVELVINGYVLFINRKSVPNIWWRVAPILIGLLIGVAIGSYILSLVHPSWVKFVTYFMLLPLILLQAAGIRKPIKAEKAIAVPFGVAIGTLYSVTTISGPPLALLFNNQGYAKQDFRAALGVIRVGEAVMTGIAYYFIGLYSVESLEIIPYIIPSVLLGIPLGSYLIRLMDPETFRRICMAFDALIVAFGMSRVLIELNLAAAVTTYSILSIVMILNAYLLFRYFRDRTVP
ncbi:MAG: sulfite exporter TauE/SafE family protein [Nitrospirota bacterium]|nr:sulfite exporter TauE/SafE family protein [Nitrospirota bacterium]MDP2381645.1 sulfite exporter TauE/SafE family protein [Nitrospirota bacterium]MDP3598589.1 sulfite exporter TauE/SafE family protein [Nitrospirota bacterium]